ncbi:sigma-70 family RNA polymerase sigma factor [Paenarthrobacter sp. DKR-5]|uniref:RNA polymerase sigma factor n=1 Tax=Paenarthrobacter sp. DKR-5 TaxID=2835535 RepID=UPI001BDBD257|nr:sigma-70 family RNA polymerase sigma factor [Paenarthrobacter sp. DKR-5]MBT1004418.1 sigma-70 family RNA polymerase sigma factor [Paenarthrobacter sp. DKR-5]
MPLEPFERVVARYGPAVLRVCTAVVGPVDAEDAWSETFLAALRAYPRLEPGSNVEAWLVTIARRKAIDVHRARSRAPLPVEELPLPPASGTEDDGRSLREALKTLPDKQRRAIAYHHLAGLPYAEVAVILGNSEAAARRAAADGMKTLRALHQAGDLP